MAPKRCQYILTNRHHYGATYYINNMGKKREELMFNEFSVLVKAGAEWLLLNAKEETEPNNELIIYLKKVRKKECNKTKPNLIKVLKSLEFAVLTGGNDILKQIMEGNYDFRFLWVNNIRTQS